MLRPMILAGLAMLGLAAPAAALPLARPEAPAAPVVRVYGGCGPFGHRGPYGGCRRGGQLGGYVPGRACPPGWHIGPYGRRCWRNRGYYPAPIFRTYGYGYRRFGWHRGWGWRHGWHGGGWHRGWGWHGGGRRWGGFRHGGFHGGWHHGGWHRGGFHRGGWHRGGFHHGGFRHHR